MLKDRRKNKGFTLIELLVVVAIIGILASIVFVNVSTVRKKARDAKRIVDIKQIQLALEMYQDKYGSYPNINQARSHEAKWLILESALNQWLGVLPKDPINSAPSIYYYDGGSGIGNEEYGLMFKFESSSNFSSADNDSGDYNRGNGEYYEIGPDPSKSGNWWTN